MKKSLEMIVFICGACVMVLELVGARLMAPYLGTSIFVWTSLIGVILGCLSLGYWFGGVLADRQPDTKALSGVLLLSGVSVAGIAVAGDALLFLGAKQFLRHTPRSRAGDACTLRTSKCTFGNCFPLRHPIETLPY